MNSKSISLILSFLILVNGCSQPTPVTTDQVRTTWNFVMAAQSALLEEDATTKIWRITLSGVDEDIIGYSDRPQRDAQTQKVQYYVDTWPTLFRGASSGVEVPPNAVISGVDNNGDIHPVPFVITNPVYDPVGRQVTFSATLVNPDIRPLTSPSDISDVSLAIDSVDLWDMIRDCDKAIVMDSSFWEEFIPTVVSCGTALLLVETGADVAALGCAAGAAAVVITEIAAMVDNKQCKCAVCKIVNSDLHEWEGCYDSFKCTGSDR